MAKTKGESKGADPTFKSLKDQAKEAALQDGAGAVWLREDGAICIGSGCLTIKGNPTGALELAFDPNKCPVGINNAFLEAAAGAIASGKGVAIEILPKKEE